MKKLIAIIGLILLGGSIFSQNPGYMGRHVFLNMEAYISPSWKNPNAIGDALMARGLDSKTVRYLGLNYFLSPNVEVIVWRKGTVGAGYDFYKSPFYLTSSTSMFGYSYGNEALVPRAMMTAHGFNVFYKQYFGQTMAPMGNYLKFTFDGFFYRYETADNSGSRMLDLYGNEMYAGSQIGNGMLFGFKAEYGYDYFVLDCLRLSMGISLGTTFGGYKAMSRKNSEHTITDYADNRLLNAYWFGIKLGVGFLTF
jgi:hypothetical protein